MLNIPPEEKAQVEIYLTETARILRKYTEPEKLNSFVSIERELRNSDDGGCLAHHRGIFFSEGAEKLSGKTRIVKNIIGEVEISQKQAQKLGLEGKTP